MEAAARARGTGETRQPGNGTRAGGPEETAAPYAVIAIVPVFCLMGLLGILVCNLLKRKGYHCTANKEVGPGPGGGGSGEAGLSPVGRPGELPAGSCLAQRVRQGVACRGQIRRASWRCCLWATGRHCKLTREKEG